jgi:hypothetical protein
MPQFHVGAFISFFIATIMSVLDSLGDYSACARACHVPQPPSFAFNRGIFVEGLMSVLSGAMGCCHATVSYGGNIGAIGLTKVHTHTHTYTHTHTHTHIRAPPPQYTHRGKTLSHDLTEHDKMGIQNCTTLNEHCTILGGNTCDFSCTRLYSITHVMVTLC